MSSSKSWLTRLIEGCLRQRLMVILGTIIAVGWGLYVAPFSWDAPFERDAVPVDAIPDLSENQQIVYADWPGRSPRDVEDQITYPLTSELLGVPGVKTIRSSSMEGFSSIYVVFDEDYEYYWTRARLNERLGSLDAGVLPDGVNPQMGPDATALGQIFWYTLEARDDEGQRVGGFDEQELRAIQDFTVSQALAGAEGVSEVASIGGNVREYHVDVDPDAMRAFDVTMGDIAEAVRASNEEVGARTTEINGVEYLIRGLGFVDEIADLERAVIRTVDGSPVVVGDVARVELGPDFRRGALTRSGVEAVGGVVTARYGANPREVIENVRDAIEEVEPSLPSRELDDGTVAQVEIVPFYDRTNLIERTLGTLNTALAQQIMIAILVILLLMLHLRTSLIVSGLLPLAVLATFVAMKYTGVDANVLALAGIAIAIGTMVDMGIIITENIAQHIDDDPLGLGGDRIERVARGAAEVAPAVVTAIATTVISFLPVFLLTGQEGRLFTPLAFTKTYALIASLFVAVMVIPVISSVVMGEFVSPKWLKRLWGGVLAVGSVGVAIWVAPVIGVAAALAALAWVVDETVLDKADPDRERKFISWALKSIGLGAVILAMAWLLTQSWMPLGADVGRPQNFLFVFVVVGGLLGAFWLLKVAYEPVLRFTLRYRIVLVVATVGFIALGGWIWTQLDREFMPHLDEGAFLYMPQTYPHASIGQALEMTKQADLLIETIPEVEESIGKLGRAETALDPAPIGMLETVVQYQPEYKLDDHGQRMRFAVDDDGEFVLEDGELVPDERGMPYRNWRDEIERPRDIWDEIIDVTDPIPGLPSTSMLQPISTRITMLQSGIRAPMAVRLMGDDLEDLAEAGLEVEEILRNHPKVESSAVNADRPVGKPYLHVEPSREQLARYGISMEVFQNTFEMAVAGQRVTETVEGRERFGVRVRYPRELRDDPEAIERILLPTGEGAQIPLGEVAEVTYERGPEMIRSEDSALVSYVMFDAVEDHGPIDVVEAVDETMSHYIEEGHLELPQGVRYSFAGEYEQNERAQNRLLMIVPMMLLIIFCLIYMQFRSVFTSLAIFSAVAVAFSGGFILLWLYGQPWFLDIQLLGSSMRDVFQIGEVKLSIAVWVGFIALFGIAADNGIVMATYLKQRFEADPPETLAEVDERVVEAGLRRVRPCLMTSATTILAMLPILTSYGTGADVMIPMAVPIVGGVALALLTLFLIPMLYGVIEEVKFRVNSSDQREASASDGGR